MKRGSFACYSGHEIRSSTVLLQSCLSYTPIDSKSNVLGKYVDTNNYYIHYVSQHYCDSKIIFTSSSNFLFFILICDNLETQLKCGFLFDKLSKICSEAKQR